VTRFVPRLLLLAAATCALGMCLGASSEAPAWADERSSHSGAGGLCVPQRVESSILTVRSRVPVPSSAAVVRTLHDVAFVADAAGAAHAVSVTAGTPLYARLRVFRL
jgi:hypothetical protein